jgi:hypothetical protein
MRIDAQGDGDVSMAKELADHFHVGALQEQQRGAHMPEIMKAHHRQIRALQER